MSSGTLARHQHFDAPRYCAVCGTYHGDTTACCLRVESVTTGKRPYTRYDPHKDVNSTYNNRIRAARPTPPESGGGPDGTVSGQ